MLEWTDESNGALKIAIAPNEDSSVYNPALVILDWGTAGASPAINGEEVVQGPKFRVGHRHRLENSDQIVWIEYEATDPIEIVLKPR